MQPIIAKISQEFKRILSTGEGIGMELAVDLGGFTPDDLVDLLPLTNRLRQFFCGRQPALCAIANAKSGKCPEDCAFCAQSSHYRTGAASFALVSPAALLEQAARAREYGVSNFSVVTSGSAVQHDREVRAVEEMIAGIAGLGMGPCASLGFLEPEAAVRYKRAGLRHYHHNLETARSFFPRICTTHDYERAVATVRTAKEAGLYVCSGGIIGMGENWEQRVELAFTLRELEVDSIPLNFLHPVPGTPLGTLPGPGDFSSLLSIAMFRLVCPTRDIRVCGGRQLNFPDTQGMLFAAGANGLMVGNYLTTSGRQWSDDRRLLAQWGMAADDGD